MRARRTNYANHSRRAVGRTVYKETQAVVLIRTG